MYSDLMTGWRRHLGDADRCEQRAKASQCRVGMLQRGEQEQVAERERRRPDRQIMRIKDFKSASGALQVRVERLEELRNGPCGLAET